MAGPGIIANLLKNANCLEKGIDKEGLAKV